VDLGYAISSEEYAPRDLVVNAVRAEQAGFGFALVSDHVQPWIDSEILNEHGRHSRVSQSMPSTRSTIVPSARESP
jgi:alkanesulfonate monooxygenase SsuD/methylene tetrahydromethanopterin reductase-like flavin-dependent oxidoreductase (luciferase family)